MTKNTEKQHDIENKNIIIPDELKIYLHTNVPGFQHILYQPKMTIPGEKNKHIEFNPLVKLKKSVINTLPENIRIKEFFVPGLFDSLINAHGSRSKISLEEATNAGYIDNNISITLNTIFPVKSILYIDKEPYTIADVDWKQHDWKINVKQKNSNDDNSSSSQPKEPSYDNKLIQQELVRGEKQMANLTTDIAYGSNYNGPKSKLVSDPIVKDTNNEEKLDNVTTTNTTTENKPENKEEIKENTTPPNNLNNSNKSVKPLPLLYDDPVLEPKIEYNTKIVEEIRDFFKNPKYTYIMDSIFQNMDEKSKQIILNNYRESSSKNVQVIKKEDPSTINTIVYENNIDGLQIVANKGGGNCFFIAVADGINYYNFMNQQNKIKIGNYGSGELLITQQVLRQLTYEFIYNTFIKNKSKEEITQYFEHANVYVDNLNNLFKEQLIQLIGLDHDKPLDDIISTIIDKVTPEQYEDIKLSVYKNNPNYLVTYDTGKPININSYTKPFRIVQEFELQKYILSNHYWGDETAIEAIKNKLGLNVIPLEYTSAISKKTIVDKESINISRNYFVDDNWDKYMFLLHTPGHFELIQFTFEENKMNNKNKIIKSKTKVTIYNRHRNINNNPNSKFIPPMYILVIIFGRLFVSLNNPLKQSFTLLQNVFMSMFNAFTKIINENTKENTEENKEKFIQLFLEYFPNAKNIIQSIHPIIGGDEVKPYNVNVTNNYYTNPYNPNYHSNKTNHKDNKNNKNNKNNDEIQICYIIDVNMMLKKGTDIANNDISNLVCDRKWNAINKSFNNLIGRKYEMTPDYNNMPDKFKTTKNNNKTLKSKYARGSKTVKNKK